MATEREETDSVFPEDFEQELDPPSRSSSRPGSQSPTEMDNILWDELPVEKLYEHFTQANDLPYVVRSFDALKTKLELNGLEGIALFRALQLKLGTQKTWKARDVLQMLDKRANQQEYMQQTAAKGVKVLIGKEKEGQYVLVHKRRGHSSYCPCSQLTRVCMHGECEWLCARLSAPGMREGSFRRRWMQVTSDCQVG